MLSAIHGPWLASNNWILELPAVDNMMGFASQSWSAVAAIVAHKQDAIQEHPGPLSSAAHRLQAGLKDSLQQLPRVVRGHVETHRARAELKRIEKEARRRLAEHEAYKRLQVEQEMQAAFETRFEVGGAVS